MFNLNRWTIKIEITKSKKDVDEWQGDLWPIFETWWDWTIEFKNSLWISMLYMLMKMTDEDHVIYFDPLGMISRRVFRIPIVKMIVYKEPAYEINDVESDQTSTTKENTYFNKWRTKDLNQFSTFHRFHKMLHFDLTTGGWSNSVGNHSR